MRIAKNIRRNEIKKRGNRNASHFWHKFFYTHIKRKRGILEHHTLQK